MNFYCDTFSFENGDGYLSEYDLQIEYQIGPAADEEVEEAAPGKFSKNINFKVF